MSPGIRGFSHNTRIPGKTPLSLNKDYHIIGIMRNLNNIVFLCVYHAGVGVHRGVGAVKVKAKCCVKLILYALTSSWCFPRYGQGLTAANTYSPAGAIPATRFLIALAETTPGAVSPQAPNCVAHIGSGVAVT